MTAPGKGERDGQDPAVFAQVPPVRLAVDPQDQGRTLVPPLPLCALGREADQEKGALNFFLDILRG